MAQLYARRFKFPKFNQAKGILAGKLPPDAVNYIAGTFSIQTRMRAPEKRHKAQDEEPSRCLTMAFDGAPEPTEDAPDFGMRSLLASLLSLCKVPKSSVLLGLPTP